MKLQDYQKKMLEDIKKILKSEHDSTLLVLPTDTGKTIVFVEIADRFKRSGRVLIVATVVGKNEHRRMRMDTPE